MSELIQNTVQAAVGACSGSGAKGVLDAPRIWLVLARAYGSIAAYIESSFGDRGFGLTDFMVLEVLLHKGPQPISAIGEKVLLASASMTSAIDRLEKRGLVRRGGSECDRRVKMIELTCEGRIFAEQIYRHHVEDIERITADLSAEERRVLHSGLKKMGLAAQAARRDARLVQIEVPSGETATLALKTSTQAGKEDMARSSAQTVAGKSRKED
jgi:MarR family 2-MHQ and catechol resistance regulon transcriptional repressor